MLDPSLTSALASARPEFDQWSGPEFDQCLTSVWPLLGRRLMVIQLVKYWSKMVAKLVKWWSKPERGLFIIHECFKETVRSNRPCLQAFGWSNTGQMVFKGQWYSSSNAAKIGRSNRPCLRVFGQRRATGMFPACGPNQVNIDFCPSL